ncbi:protein cortex isoform X2 [Aethina tumida]|uniref:protein cortex isoform X2 n=1 Tax=Aethina tumida TaxID=116153 RepID=UPI0021474339|nr:protein cortex isoform X2 [Aethina tumida]
MNQTDETNSTDDRYIPKRSITNMEISHYKLKPPYEEITDMFNHDDVETYLNVQRCINNKRQYTNKLSAIFLITQAKILNFSYRNIGKLELCLKHTSHVWPVYPRKKPLMANSPEFILDMPDLDLNTVLFFSIILGRHAIDWGKTGYIATIHKQEVHIWNPENKLLREVTSTQRNVKDCVKWSKCGIYFAAAIGQGKCAIINSVSRHIIGTINCICTNCVVKAIEWTRNKEVITGCSCGVMTVTSIVDTSHQSKVYKDFLSLLITIKLSCNERFLVAIFDGGIARIYRFPEFQYYLDIESGYERNIGAVAWHPWKESLLCYSVHAEVRLVNLITKKHVSHHIFPNDTFHVDALLFNPLSGELVVSRSVIDPTHTGYLTVFENFDNVVEEIRCSYERMRFMLWDSTGTQLATVSTLENLCIWNFFGTAKERSAYIKNKRMDSVNLDPKSTVFMMGNTIR